MVQIREHVSWNMFHIDCFIEGEANSIEASSIDWKWIWIAVISCNYFRFLWIKKTNVWPPLLPPLIFGVWPPLLPPLIFGVHESWNYRFTFDSLNMISCQTNHLVCSLMRKVTVTTIWHSMCIVTKRNSWNFVLWQSLMLLE